MADNAEHKETIVVGAGPGGYVAAIHAAQLGQKVTLIERDDTLGGTCLNVGCVPSKALIQAGHRFQEALDASVFGVASENVTIDWGVTQNWKQQAVVDRMTGGIRMLMKKNKVEVIQGVVTLDNNTTLRVMPAGPAQFMSADNGQVLTFDNLILATGSRPIEIKGFPFGERVIDSTGGLALKEIPKKLVVIGGGYIGCELAGVYANLGTQVTILEGLPTILSVFEKDIVVEVKKHFKKLGVTLIEGAMAKKADESSNGVQITYELDGKTDTIEADYVMVTVGRRPNTDEIGLEFTDVKMGNKGLIEVDEQGRTSVPNIFAVGDIVAGPALAHKAFFEGKTAADAISGGKETNDYIGVPAVCFTDPEIATVGLTESQAKQAGYQARGAKFPFAGNARSVALDEPVGFVRWVAEEATGTVLGCQIVGPHASDLISEAAVAVNCQLNIEDISRTIHPHPTLSEPIVEAADVWMGFPTHI